MTYLEYIEFSGNQCLDVDFKPSFKTRVIMDVELHGISNNLLAFYGARDTNSATAAKQFVAWMDGAGTRIRSDYFGTSVTADVDLDYQRFIVDQNRNLCTANGVTATNTVVTTGTCSYNLFIGAVNNVGAHAYGIHGKVYSCKVYDDNVLVRDLIPARDIYGVAGMWDKVEKRFFWNVGGGEIEGGPVKSIGMISHIFTGLENGRTYYARVFTLNPKGRVNNRVDLPWASAIPAAGLDLSTIPTGSILMINESGSPVPFYIAKHDYESDLNGAGRTLLVRKDCLGSRLYHSTANNSFATSDMNTWLNGTYANLLDSNVRSAAGTTKFHNTVGYGSSTMTTLERKVFLLSLTELGLSYSGVTNVEGSTLPIADTLKIAYYSGYTVRQWTRTPMLGSSGSNPGNVMIADSSGKAAFTGANSSTVSKHPRPCFTLPGSTKLSYNTNADGSYSLL